MKQEKKEKKTPGEKKEKFVRLFWDKFVSEYFSFCFEKFGERPSFDGSSPRDLGMIYDAIKKKAEEKKMIWNEDLGLRSLKVFLEYCFKDGWLHKNFLLFNLNRQKDKIFFQIKQEMDGKSNSKSEPAKQRSSFKTAGQEVFADRLRSRLEKLQ